MVRYIRPEAIRAEVGETNRISPEQVGKILRGDTAIRRNDWLSYVRTVLDGIDQRHEDAVRPHHRLNERYQVDAAVCGVLPMCGDNRPEGRSAGDEVAPKIDAWRDDDS